MRKQHSRSYLLLPVILLAASSSNLAFQKKQKPVIPGKPIIWSDPGAVESLDFVGGIGGREQAPKPPFTFVEESESGTNPKVKVTDANGVQWLMNDLGRITDAQLREGLQASGATPDEVSCFTASIRNRIDQLKTVR